MKSAKDKYNFLIYSYCLMNNHVHLQLETSDTEIWKIMRRINYLYARYFNSKNNYVGHVFQGRYKSTLIEDELYNLQVSKYIHLNPVKASMTESPKDYKWSSYSEYLEIGEGDTDTNIDTNTTDTVMKFKGLAEVDYRGLVEVEKILRFFSFNRRAAYRTFVEGDIDMFWLTDVTDF